MGKEVKSYRATPDELRAIDAGLLNIGGPSIADAELPDFYRSQAAQYRAAADQAETVEMRIALLDFADQLERQAENGVC